MASAAIWDALSAWLVTDIRTGVNAEQTNALVAGSVFIARRSTSLGARDPSTYPLSVAIVLRGRRPEADGTGWDLVHVDVDLEIVLRRKDLAKGSSQVNTIEDVVRALERRYRNVSSLAIVVTGATFRRSDARLLELDERPEAGELARAVMRATFSFNEPFAANA